MSQIIYHFDIIQGSPEWLERRKGKWTGTSAIRLLQGKPMPRDTEFAGNIHTRRGQLLETIAITEYERHFKCEVIKPGFVTNSVYKNAGYSPDGLDGRILLEVKALNGDRHDKLAGGEIPLDFLVQIYFGMIITGLRKAKLLAFNPERTQQLTILDVPYDKAIGANIRRKLRSDMLK